MKLTKNNYFTIKNQYISNSKISDYLKDPEYFYKKHVTGEIKFEMTPSMIIGKAVDIYLTNSPKKFHDTYTYACLKKDDPEMFAENKDTTKEILTKSQYDKVINICESVTRTSAYKVFKKFKKQEILQKDMKLGIFKGLCGIPDGFQITKDKCTIVDLKTSSTIQPNKYHYHCLEFGYYRQLALYADLIQNKYPEVKYFKYYHLVVENTGDINRVATFEFDPLLIEDERQILYKIIKEIADTKVFKFHDVSFKNAEKIWK
ncbi:MAG: hypothetical protein PHF05_06370 [Candidatus Izemoplasmatales bacterium]|nr:hypothetical protein [Candidatus Izemoplasmatales bacterium]